MIGPYVPSQLPCGRPTIDLPAGTVFGLFGGIKVAFSAAADPVELRAVTER